MAAPKKKPITSSSNRTDRSKSSATSANKKTTSSGKAAGSNPKIDARLQRQKNSTAKVTKSGGGTRGSAKVTQNLPKLGPARSAKGTIAGAKPPKGLLPAGKTKTPVRQGLIGSRDPVSTKGRAPKPNWGGSKGSAPTSKPSKPTRGPGTKSPAPKPAWSEPSKAEKATRALTSGKVIRKPPATVGSIAKGMIKGIVPAAGRASVRGAVAAEGLTSRNTADGTLKGKPTGPSQGPPNKDAGKTKAQSFDAAFKKASQAGKKEFSWNGKSYNTKKA